MSSEIANAILKNPIRGAYTMWENGINYEVASSWGRYLTPPGYTLSNDAIYTEKVVTDRKTQEESIELTTISRTPFIISARTEQLEDGTIYYTIRYGHDGEQKEFVCTYSDINGQKAQVKKTLAAHGINVPDNDMLNGVIEYISMYIKEFGNLLHVETAVTHNGWNNNYNLFAMGNNGITKNGVTAITTALKDTKFVTIFKTEGTLDGWVNGVKDVLEYDVSRFSFYDGMSAPLFCPLNQENSMLIHNGRSSRFKTGLAWINSSTMCNPVEIQLMGASTPIGMLIHVVGMCDMPVDIEEITDKESKEKVANLIYTIYNGGNRSKGTKTNTTHSDQTDFRTSVRITTEHPLTPFIKNTGAKLRAKHYRQLLPDNLGKLAMSTTDSIQRNYGFFYPIYIQHIIENMDRLKPLYEEAYSKLPAEYKNVPAESIGMIERQKKTFACNIVAGYLVEEVFKKIGIPSKTKEEVDRIVTDAFNDIVIAEPVEQGYIKALKEISAWVARNPTKFYNRESNEVYNHSGLYGEVTSTEIKIVGTAFTEKMIEIGESDEVINDFMREGIVKHKGRRTTFRLMSEPASGIIINKKALYDKIEMEEVQTEKPTMSEAMRFQEIAKTIEFVTKTISKGPISDITLRVILKYDPKKYLDKMYAIGKVFRDQNGDYY